MEKTRVMTEREFLLLSGKDIKPITRREMYYRAIYFKTQYVPVPITREEIALNNIVNHIRELESKGEENE